MLNSSYVLKSSMLRIIHFSALLVYSDEQPDERWTIMGYYKNLEIELQEIHDDELREIVAWDKAHQHQLTAEERWSILTDEVKLKRALVLWANELSHPSPKPASEHVALQVPLVRRRDLRQPKRVSYQCALIWSLIGVALVLTVALVGVLS